MFVEVTGEKVVGGGLFVPTPKPPPTPNPHIFNRVKSFKSKSLVISKINLFKTSKDSRASIFSGKR